MLRSLEIQNFKGIKQGKIEDLAQVNILVGRNNSGKSTILDALVLLRSSWTKTDFLERDGIDQIINRRVNRPNVDRAELWFNMNQRVPLVVSVGLTSGRAVTSTWSPTLDTQIRSGSVEWNVSPGFSPTARTFRDVSDWQRITKVIGDESESTHLFLSHLLDANSIHYPFAEKLWPELTTDRREDKVRQMLERIYGIEIHYIASMPFPRQQRLVAALPHAGVAVDWLGDGFRYALNILALGMFIRGTSLLVEELETHQHPESLRKLTQALFELAKEQDLQLFLTTHSLELIDYAMEAAQERGLDLKLHHLTLDKEGTLRVTSMSQPSAQLLLDIGHDPRLHYKYIGVE